MKKSKSEKIYLAKIFNSKIILLTIFVVVLSLIAFFSSNEDNSFWINLNSLFVYPWFNIIYFSILIINAYIINNIYENNYEYVIRCKNKLNLNKKIVLNILKFNMYFILVSFIFIMFFILLQSHFNISIERYYYYNVYINIYALFMLFKFIIFSLLIPILVISIKKIFSEKITTLFILLMLIDMLFSKSKEYVIASILKMPITIGGFLNFNQYSSFFFEIVNTFFFILILIALVVVLFILSTKYNKGDEK